MVVIILGYALAEGAMAPQILADQLTLTRGADYAHHVILAPPDFRTFLRP